MFNAIFIQVKKLVVVLLDVDTNEVLERWEFNIEIEDDAKEAAKENIGGNNTEKKDTKPGSVRVKFVVGTSDIFQQSKTDKGLGGIHQ